MKKDITVTYVIAPHKYMFDVWCYRFDIQNAVHISNWQDFNGKNITRLDKVEWLSPNEYSYSDYLQIAKQIYARTIGSDIITEDRLKESYYE